MPIAFRAPVSMHRMTVQPDVFQVNFGEWHRSRFTAGGLPPNIYKSPGRFLTLLHRQFGRFFFIDPSQQGLVILDVPATVTDFFEADVLVRERVAQERPPDDPGLAGRNLITMEPQSSFPDEM
jgi:hypothetical protein